MDCNSTGAIWWGTLAFLSNGRQCFIGASIFFFTCLLGLYYHFICLPTNWIKDLTAVGFSHIPKQTKREKLALGQPIKRKDANDLPPVYPNGWFAIAESRSLQARKCLTIFVLGQELIVFRGEDGKAHVMDAFCPHLGAHLGVGGQVLGNCIECPFHGWIFRGFDGKCVQIPNKKSVPDFIRTKSWPVSEKNGFVFMWYHAENEDPVWSLPDAKNMNVGCWNYIGRTEHRVKCHIQDIPENGADYRHLEQIHAASALSGNTVGRKESFWGKFLRHKWTSTWKPETDSHSHIATMSMEHQATFLGIQLNFLKVTLSLQQVSSRRLNIKLFGWANGKQLIGPGVVYMNFDTPFGEGMFIQCVTPKGPLHQCLVHHLYTSLKFPRIIAKLYILMQAIMVERDIMIWNSKKFMKKPKLIKEDSLIVHFRRWYSQFYTENSPTLLSVAAQSLTW